MNGWIEKTGQRTEKWELVTGNWELGKGNPIHTYVCTMLWYRAD